MAAGEGRVEHDLSIPSPDAGQILIRTHAVALNPPDWITQDFLSRPAAGAGFDFSGGVVEIGEDAQASWAVGDRVAGLVHGCMCQCVAQLWHWPNISSWTILQTIALGHFVNT